MKRKDDFFDAETGIYEIRIPGIPDSYCFPMGTTEAGGIKMRRKKLDTL